MEPDAYAVSNLEGIELNLTLSNPHGLNLRHPFLWPTQDSEGKILAPPTLSVMVKRLSGSHREDVETQVGGGGISRRYDDTTIFLSIEIPITALERMKGITEYVNTLFTKPEEAESREVGRKLGTLALLLSRYPQNQVGVFEVVATYSSFGPEYWEGRVSCPPIRLEIEDDGTFFDKMRRQETRSGDQEQ